jgi:hypothetical protein
VQRSQRSGPATLARFKLVPLGHLLLLTALRYVVFVRMLPMQSFDLLPLLVEETAVLAGVVVRVRGLRPGVIVAARRLPTAGLSGLDLLALVFVLLPQGGMLGLLPRRQTARRRGVTRHAVLRQRSIGPRSRLLELLDVPVPQDLALVVLCRIQVGMLPRPKLCLVLVAAQLHVIARNARPWLLTVSAVDALLSSLPLPVMLRAEVGVLFFMLSGECLAFARLPRLDRPDMGFGCH